MTVSSAPNLCERSLARRRLLGWLAGSPLLAAAASTGSIAALLAVASRAARAQSTTRCVEQMPCGRGRHHYRTSRGAERLRVRGGGKKGPVCSRSAHALGYLESGVDGDVTRDANHTAYERYNIASSG